MDVGGVVFIVFLFSFSVVILAIWFLKGDGLVKQKAKFLVLYLAVTILPAILFHFVASAGYYQLIANSIAFIFIVFVFLSGFIVPILGKTFLRKNT